MARPPKNKAAAEAKASASAAAAQPKVIDVDNFIRIRDSVYARLTTIQDLIKSFSVDYLRQTNLLLGEGTNLENVDIPALEAALGGFAPVAQAPAAVAAPAAAAAPAADEKKERKKRTVDPNAPKRPLTPFFLYMQTARPIIGRDLGDAPKGAIQDEGQRRWKDMNPEEKAAWDTAYQYNLRLYNARVHSYKHEGNLNAKNMTDAEAADYADSHNIQAKDTAGAGADEPDAQLQASAAAEAAAEPAPAAEEEEAPSKTPKKAKGGKRKSTAATPAAPAEEAKAAATPATADKKRKRASKAAAEEPEPKKSGRKKSKSN